jgi:hypothetical protein
MKKPRRLRSVRSRIRIIVSVITPAQPVPMSRRPTMKTAKEREKATTRLPRAKNRAEGSTRALGGKMVASLPKSGAAEVAKR